MIDHYILVGQTPVPVDADARTPEGFAGLMEWARWFETADRHVMRTRILDDLCEVSTVFLGLDHGFGGRPLLFEGYDPSMVELPTAAEIAEAAGLTEPN